MKKRVNIYLLWRYYCPFSADPEGARCGKNEKGGTVAAPPFGNGESMWSPRQFAERFLRNRAIPTSPASPLPISSTVPGMGVAVTMPWRIAPVVFVVRESQ